MKCHFTQKKNNDTVFYSNLFYFNENLKIFISSTPLNVEYYAQAIYTSIEWLLIIFRHVYMDNEKCLYHCRKKPTFLYNL